MAKRLSDTEIWRKDWFLDLSIKQKLLVKFLFDNCDCAGIYEISYRTLRNCFNEEITKKDFEGLKQIKFLNENTIFIEDFIKFQYNCEISNLNPKYSVHRGIIKILNKYGLFETLTQGLGNPSIVRVLDKDKDKDKDNTINLHINTSNYNNNDEKIKKLDPYVNPIGEFFKSEYKKIIGTTPRLSSLDCNRLIELAAENPDIKEIIPIAINRLKTIDFKDIQFTPSANWLLKGNNFERVINGEFEPKETEEEKRRKRFCGGC